MLDQFTLKFQKSLTQAFGKQMSVEAILWGDIGSPSKTINLRKVFEEKGSFVFYMAQKEDPDTNFLVVLFRKKYE